MHGISRWLFTCLLSMAAGATATASSPEPAMTTPVDLQLQHLYEFPVGPLGLAPTAELKRLAGRRVRITGYMVEEQEPLAGQFKLTLLPVKLAEREDGPADDLPAATVVVHLSSANALRAVKFDPNPIVVTGTLELGPREEPDGRISQVRLLLDPDHSTESFHAP
jgi:hypothetical protein